MKPLANPARVHVGDAVDVYFNLGDRTFSIRRGGKVIERTDGPIWLRDATFHVDAAGRDRVRAEQSKNLHAFVRGRIGERARVDLALLLGEECIAYDPYTDDGFVTLPRCASGRVVKSAKLVCFVVVNNSPEVRAFMVEFA